LFSLFPKTRFNNQTSWPNNYIYKATQVWLMQQTVYRIDQVQLARIDWFKIQT